MVRREVWHSFLSGKLEDMSGITSFGWYRRGDRKLSFQSDQLLNFTYRITYCKDWDMLEANNVLRRVYNSPYLSDFL